jgi:GDPmannose 4,6-dehydratase
MYAYWITVNYREAYGLYACNGILFNHESPRRGETFVTRKITRGLANISVGLQECLYMGNIDALRDWGHAKDYVRMQWLMLQQNKPEDYVIATGMQYSVRQFIDKSAKVLGMEIKWEGSGINEVGYWMNPPHGTSSLISSIENNNEEPTKVAIPIVRMDTRYYRPAEVESLLGDPNKAMINLGWKPEITLDEMIIEMLDFDIMQAKRQLILRKNGYHVDLSFE